MRIPNPENDALQARPNPDRDEFVSRYLDDRNRDVERDLSSYLEEFPGIADFVRAEFPKLQAIWNDDESPNADAHWIGHYRVIRRIAEGGMGVLYLAKDPDLGREVAIKTLRPGTLGDASRDRLMREARIMGRLESKHICEVLHIIEEEGTLSVVMPFVRGETLAKRIERARELSTKSATAADFWVSIADSEEAMQASESKQPGGLGGQDESRFGRDDVRPVLLFMEKIARAVHEAHQNKIVHRDLKPHNVMVQPDGQPVVLDFGLARDLEQLENSLTSPGEVLGTAFYMPPEQVQADEATARSDVYSLGVILYEMLTLERPYTGKTRREVSNKILAGRAIWPRRLNNKIPPDLDAVCMMAMECEAGRRYRSAEALADDLHCVRSLKPTEARPDTWWSSVGRFVRHNKVRVGAGAGITSLVAALLLLINGLQSEQDVSGALQAIMAYSATTAEPGESDTEKKERAVAALRHFGLDEELLARDRWKELVALLGDVLSRSGYGEGRQWRVIQPRLVIVDAQPEFVFELPMPEEPDVPLGPGFSMRFEVIVEGGGETQRLPFTQGPEDGGTHRLRPENLRLRPDVDYRWTVRLAPNERDELRPFFQPAAANFHLADPAEREVLPFRDLTGDDAFDRIVHAARLIDRGRVGEALETLDPSPAHPGLRHIGLFLRAKCHALFGDQEALHAVRGEAFPRPEKRSGGG
jgi:serine/threonine protein kinase